MKINEIWESVYVNDLQRKPSLINICSAQHSPMLRLNTLVRSSTRSFSSSVSLQAAPNTSKTKAIAKGFKGSATGKKSRKTAGSFRFFEDHVHYAKNREPGFELSNLETLNPTTLDLNKVVSYSEQQLQKLIQAGSFKKDQFHELFKTPITLIRDETSTMAQFVQDIATTPSSQNKICLIGERGIGKSTLLTQAQALAISQSNTIVIPISHALKLVDGSNDFFYDSKLQTYTQPMYLKKLLSKIEYINKELLSQIQLSQDYVIEGVTKDKAATKFNQKHTLSDLVQATNLAPRQRGRVFQILIQELLNQDSHPVLVTVDNFSAITSHPITPYRNVENKQLYVEELQITKTLFQLTSNEVSFKKGGVILATSSDDKPSVTLKHGLGLIAADPYTKESDFNRTLASKITTVKPITVGKLQKECVGKLVEKYIEANAFNKTELENNNHQNLIDQKYVLSGNGNPLELLKSITMYH
ncbi:hypothetical protein WICPIJ_003604 [Wickerhamomyces pijperi]|uniref:Small ribosomal subunit protein mS29 n=1 Tax=Wickerhamomyces pijperi TaxID=599730 RepID=A0A9P8Q9L0_WICPI|nr:hypothetical protein WICPIJ_003604 [Wickerhamomyces pijperi]